MRDTDALVKVWIVLIALTAGSFAVIEGNLLPAIAAVIVVALTCYKARLIIAYFMEAKKAPRTFQIMYGAWVLVAATIILGGHYLAVFVSCHTSCPL
jgi:heme/copper-type cytochrome/quinol oxidase subunit 4